ncbi:hypothetical protein PUNSTDRAFT_40450, partial [Punctularia strigosozonata HHB-11173 SS5]|uniref:uncharacterized protein n=1 Tax=Punctularia strigosozonata (strain HHB-11173) TaxID=741275 RepID=UPI00044164AD
QILLVHGDLLTGERVRQLQKSRGDERSVWNRFQFIVFVMGYFHVKMACADALWRIFISPPDARQDNLSLMSFVAELRPKEMGTFGSKSGPGFRRMHEVIQHVGAVWRLNAWREKLKSMNFATLEDFANSDPSWAQIEQISFELAREQVATEDFWRLRSTETAKRDKQRENALLREQYFLLYEEITWALNAGDVGRVECCLVPWAFLFKACGKHKYAAHVLEFLHDLHVVYPKEVRLAIQKNILVNPTGRKNAWRPVDWLVEHNNLYIKRIYGGKNSNRTVARIMQESSLIATYKKIRTNFEKMFVLDGRSTKHTTPDMTKTFAKLASYMDTHRAHAFVEGRETKHVIPDMLGKGMNDMMTTHHVHEGLGSVLE